MTERLEQFVDAEVKKQVARIMRYANSDSEPTAEDVYTTIQISKAYLTGIGKTLNELGKVRNHASDWIACRIDSHVWFNPLTGKYEFK